jgi:hypothetical protein
MRVYTLKANVNNYQILTPVDAGIYESYQHFNGEPHAIRLETLTVAILPPDQVRRVGDFPGLASHIPVFSYRSMAVLGKMLGVAGELMTLNCGNCEAEYMAVNVTCLIDALDENRSKVKRYRSSGRIMRILQYEFKKESLPEVAIFKIPETVLKEVYVTDGFVAQVVKACLEGFVFKLIWTDKDPIMLCPYCLGIIEEQVETCFTCGLDMRQDAPLEMSLAEAQDLKRSPCQFCGMRIQAWADPCPYCNQGRQRQGLQTGIAIVC